ncbi:LytTR family DNA-binding domain-containing protein [Roseobacter sp.]|uniref:LytTR family DNA-binding domain-containing protein n=1 Tax=Roseobacter sp. TaxID=1907202 RepID=UPI0029660CBC|nr:LytTR family DNA-binding domain-containing protein [Roseobacter sp.]MDW3181995.1 LytTR family DNA-binding domain-containing protein [Roseobacter sp.]
MAKVANDTVVAQTIAEARALAQRGRFWAALLGLGFVIGLTGPFGTYDTLPTVLRAAYWTVVVTTTFWLGYLVSFAVATCAEAYGIDAPISLGIGAVVASVPLTAWLAGLHMVFFATPFWANAGELLPYVIVISFAAATLFEAVSSREVVPVPRATSTSGPAWLDQLPAHLGKDLILLHAQDHYVRAETALGQTLIRTTLHDAATDLGDYGIRLHRSWWVARSAIQAQRYRNGAPVVVLQDGRELPVGRTYRRALKDALR